jgi:hypothetical protein
MNRRVLRLITLIFPLTLLLVVPHSQAQDGTDPVEQSLNSLGVNTNAGARADANGNPVSDDYSPLGNTYSPGQRVELAVMGVELDGAAAKMAIVDDFGDSAGLLTSREDTPFLESNVLSRGNPNTRRNAAAGDTDGDGRDELVAAYMRDQEVVLRVFDDASGGFAETESVLVLAQDVQDMQVATGDVNGDGRAEVLIALSYLDRGELLVAGDAGGRFALLQGGAQPITATLPGANISMEVATGNTDYDRAAETVVVFNEIAGDDAGISQYFVYDDANAGYTILNGGLVQGIVEGIKSALIGNAVFGDIDGDGLDEVVLAGLTNRATQCDTSGHLLVALDDGIGRFANIGTYYQDIFMRGCPSFSAWRLRYLHLNAFDVDGDFIDEISVNQFVFEDWKNEAPFTVAYEIPVENNLIDVNDFGWWDRSTSDFAVGDFTGDGRANLLIYMQNRNTIDIWGLGADNVWQALNTIPVTFHNAQDPIVPLLVPLNADEDSPVMQYVEADYQLVFTEPIVIAALAAPPCGAGAVIENCATIFGSETSSSAEAETSITITSSATVGVQVDGGFITQSEFELSGTVKSTLTATLGAAIYRTDTITFGTGPGEDTVIFTSVPVDRYTYTVVTHPDPVMVNAKVAVDIPRDPVTIMVERDFFNANVAPGSIQIGDGVFQHMVGDPRSYPTRGAKQQLLGQFSGFESALQNVGQGGGTRAVEIAIGRELSAGASLGLGYETEVKATSATVMAGYSVGTEITAALRIAYGEATIYGGTVSNIDAENFASSAYSFGLFSYVYTDPSSGQQFQVLNYWVE